MIWLLVLAIPLVAVIAWPFWREARKAVPDRKKAPGKFANTGRGKTHYGWYGPSRGPVVVAIHGLTTPCAVWDRVAMGLVDLGYRVLVYDLHGRGYSDAPSGRQDRRFFLAQLDALLSDQDLREDITLLGYCMGGAIATAFAAENPDRMKLLILLASAGIIPPDDPETRFMRRVPILGEWLHAVRIPGRMRAAIAAEPPPGPGGLTEIAAVQLAELDRRGYVPAILSSQRGMMTERQEAEHRALGRTDIPVFAIWGDKDPVVPLSALGQLTAWNRAVRQEVVKGAGHDLPALHGVEVTTILRDILRED